VGDPSGAPAAPGPVCVQWPPDELIVVLECTIQLGELSRARALQRCKKRECAWHVKPVYACVTTAWCTRARGPANLSTPCTARVFERGCARVHECVLWACMAGLLG